MPSSDFVKYLDAVTKDINRFLKPLGFRKKGRTYNRGTEGGLVQIVNFQMGQFPIGEHYVIPGIRESFYGKFTVNLGILLPCVWETERQKSLPDFVQEYSCTIRERLSSLAFGTDKWFELTPDTSNLSATLVRLFDKFGLPFLDQFPNYAGVLNYFDAHGDLPCQNTGRAALEAAIVAHHLGELQKAQRLFARAQSTDHQGFRQHVSALATRLGYSVA
jgi:hypothetical protein